MKKGTASRFYFTPSIAVLLLALFICLYLPNMADAKPMSSLTTEPVSTNLRLLRTYSTTNMQCKKILINTADQVTLGFNTNTGSPINYTRRNQAPSECPAGYIPYGVRSSPMYATEETQHNSMDIWIAKIYNNSMVIDSWASGDWVYTPYINNSNDPENPYPYFKYRNQVNEVRLVCVRRLIIFTNGPCTP